MTEPRDSTVSISLDALLPAEVLERAEAVGVAKAQASVRRLTVLSILAGAFIALGATFSTVVGTSAPGGTALPFGVARLLGGLAFSLGLVLVVIAGAELFTGNNLIVIAWASRKVSTRALLRNWTIVYLGNFVGATATALLVFWAGADRGANAPIGARALAIADSKTQLGVFAAICLGVLANALVCLAVWMTMAARTVTDKVLAIVAPITAFVACGFEHSIANMYFLPHALFIKRRASDAFWVSIGRNRASYSHLTWRRALLRNLVPVTIGNVIGGALLVALVYWLAYHRLDAKAAPNT